MVDVTVIGASASGLHAASLLARSGLGVLLCERNPRLRPAKRSLIVTERMQKYLGPLAHRSVVNEIDRFELFANGRVATIPLPRPDLVIDRAALIEELSKEAGAAGVTLASATSFEGMQAGPTGVKVLVRDADGERELEARNLIGADGAFSKVGEAAGWPRQSTVPLVQAVVEMPPGLEASTCCVWFRPEETPYFYWLIPESPDRAVVGLIGTQGRTVRHHLERFLAEKGLSPIEYQAARIPEYKRWTPVRRRLGKGNVYLVGDAAGHVKVSTIGGVVTGFRGSLGVAEAIVNGGRSLELRRLRRELAVHRVVSRVLHRFDQEDYVRLLDVIDTPGRNSITAYSRDEAIRMLAGALRSRPRLLLLGLRAFLTKN